MGRFLYGHKFSVHLGKYQRAQLLDHTVRIYLVLLRNCQTVLQSGCTILHSHRKRMRVLVAPYPHQHLVSLEFQIVTFQTGLQQHLIVLICSSQVIHYFEHMFMLLLLLLLSRFSRVRLYATPQTAAHQAPPSLGFSRQEHLFIGTVICCIFCREVSLDLLPILKSGSFFLWVCWVLVVAHGLRFVGKELFIIFIYYPFNAHEICSDILDFQINNLCIFFFFLAWLMIYGFY